MMRQTDIETLAGQIETWLRSIDTLNIREDLGESNTWIKVLESTRIAGGNGTWRYYLTAEKGGLWRTYEPTEMARGMGASAKSEAAPSMMLAEAVAKSGQCCCWKSYMYDLITIDPGSAEANVIDGSDSNLQSIDDPLAATVEL